MKKKNWKRCMQIESFQHFRFEWILLSIVGGPGITFVSLCNFLFSFLRG